VSIVKLDIFYIYIEKYLIALYNLRMKGYLMMGLAENIKNIRAKHDLSQIELGKIAGVTDKAVSTWENGTAEPRMGAIQRMADYFGVTKSSIIEDQTPSNSNAVRVPVYGTVPAGIPVEAIENIIDYEEIPREMTAGGKEYFGLRVKGDSMIPDFHDGDTVLLMRQSDCENGQVAVACVNGNDATLKKIIKQEDAIILQPLNHAYEPMIYRTNDEDNPVTILGIVVEIRRKYNGA